MSDSPLLWRSIRRLSIAALIDGTLLSRHRRSSRRRTDEHGGAGAGNFPARSWGFSTAAASRTLKSRASIACWTCR